MPAALIEEWRGGGTADRIDADAVGKTTQRVPVRVSARLTTA
jgi:hypothetical protein